MTKKPDDHFSGKIALKAVVIKDGKALMMRDPRMPDIWDLPGGRLDKGEEVIEGLRREFREELGVEIKVGEMILTDHFTHVREGVEHLLIVFKATIESDEFTPSKDEVEEVQWLTWEQIQSSKTFPEYVESVKRALKK